VAASSLVGGATEDGVGIEVHSPVGGGEDLDAAEDGSDIDNGRLSLDEGVTEVQTHATKDSSGLAALEVAGGDAAVGPAENGGGLNGV
jgi:hypothetical protein